MKKPKRLQPGGHVRVVAPAARVNREKIEGGVRSLAQLGYQVTLGAHVFDENGYLAGQDDDRAADLMEALTDPSVDAVIAARGGYGTMRLLPLLDKSRLVQVEPKPVMGYSDITALHLYLQRLGWVTFHGPNIEGLWDQPNGQDALHILSGGCGTLGDGPMTLWEPGDSVAPECLWLGGNLSLLASLTGTPYAVPAGSHVLYLEEVSEPPYRIDRSLTQLRLAGALDQVQAIVFGEATRCDSQIPDYTVESIARGLAQQLGISLWSGFPSGHGPRRVTLPLGVPLAIRDGRVELSEPAVR